MAADFFTVEVWTGRGLRRFVVLFFIELSTRKVEIAGVADSVNGQWMRQMGRNLTYAADGILQGKRYWIHDRDPLFTTEFPDAFLRRFLLHTLVFRKNFCVGASSGQISSQYS